jgi:hypothetical protein
MEGITAAYTQEKAGYEAMSAEMDKTKAEFTVFERKDIKLKEDIKHIKAKDKKLKETIVKEKEKADKARESIPKQVPTLCLCLSACVHCVDMHLASSLCVAECWWMETGEGHCGGRGDDGQDGKVHPCGGRGVGKDVRINQGRDGCAACQARQGTGGALALVCTLSENPCP